MDVFSWCSYFGIEYSACASWNIATASLRIAVSVSLRFSLSLLRLEKDEMKQQGQYST